MMKMAHEYSGIDIEKRTARKSVKLRDVKRVFTIEKTGMILKSCSFYKNLLGECKDYVALVEDGNNDDVQ